MNKTNGTFKLKHTSDVRPDSVRFIDDSGVDPAHPYGSENLIDNHTFCCCRCR